MYLESQNICKNCKELFVILLRMVKLPHHHLQNLKVFSLICKSHKSVSTGETVFHIPQSACYILCISKASLSFLGSGLIFHCLLRCKEMFGGRESLEYHPVCNAKILPGFLLTLSKPFR